MVPALSCLNHKDKIEAQHVFGFFLVFQTYISAMNDKIKKQVGTIVLLIFYQKLLLC